MAVLALVGGFVVWIRRQHYHDRRKSQQGDHAIIPQTAGIDQRIDSENENGEHVVVVEIHEVEDAGLRPMMIRELDSRPIVELLDIEVEPCWPFVR